MTVPITATPESLTALAGQIGPTPVMPFAVRYRGLGHEILLKMESHLPTESVKYRTALGLVRAMNQDSALRPGTVVVESTSGGLGCALAYLLTPLGCHFIAVIDPKTTAATRGHLTKSGAVLHLVTEADSHGDYLRARLRVVRELCQTNPHYRWTDQYNNRANPLIHEETTGPEIIAQGGPELDSVYVAVSTGGTLAGIAAHIRSLRRDIRLVAVDARGSCATTSQPGVSRHIPGIGASRPSAFLHPGSYDHVIHVRDSEAIAVCQIFHSDTGIRLGGSSGHVIAACLLELTESAGIVHPLCLCADDGKRYLDTIYNARWISDMKLAAEVAAAIRRLREQGLEFRVDAT